VEKIISGGHGRTLAGSGAVSPSRSAEAV